jgi:hypothetical protein
LHGAHVAQEQFKLPLTASPCGRLSRPRSTTSQSDFHPVIRPFSPLRLGRSYKLAPEPEWISLVHVASFGCMLAVRTPGAPLTARVVAACGSAFPFERQGRLLRSRSISGLSSRSLRSGLQPPCLRFATAVTGRHARLGSRLLAKLCPRPSSQTADFNALARRNPQRTGRETRASSGSYPPASGRTPSCHRTNRLGSRCAMHPSQRTDARSRRLNRLNFRRAHWARASLR